MKCVYSIQQLRSTESLNFVSVSLHWGIDATRVAEKKTIAKWCGSKQQTHTNTHNVYICKRLPLARSLSRYRRDCSVFVWSSLSMQAHYCGSIQNSFGERNYYTRTHTHTLQDHSRCVPICIYCRMVTFAYILHTHSHSYEWCNSIMCMLQGPRNTTRQKEYINICKWQKKNNHRSWSMNHIPTVAMCVCVRKPQRI